MTTTTVYQSKAPKLGLVGGFDGIRGIGVCMVLVGHALFQFVESWVTVVDAFFVLSGFLITTLLFQEARSTGTISLIKFYQRRIIRLFPSLWLFASVWVVISLVATAVGFEELHIRNVGKDALAAFGYVYHLFFPNGLYVISPEVQAERTMWHLWTLSMEEWFYLVIAGTILICVKKMWVKQLAVLMAVAFIGIGVARWFAFTGFFQDNSGMVAGVRMAFIQRPDALILGVLMACVNTFITAEAMQRIRKPMIAVCTAGLVVWLLMLNLSSGLVKKLGGPYLEYLPPGPEEFNRPHMLDELYWFRFGHTVGAVAFGLIIVGLVHYRDWWLARFWSWKQFQWLGRLSYTLYVWHALPYLILMSLLGGEDASTTVAVARTPILIAAAFAISMPVYYYVELRVLKIKLKFSAEKEALDLRTGQMVDTRTGKPIKSSDHSPATAPTNGAVAPETLASQGTEPVAPTDIEVSRQEDIPKD